MRSLCAAHVNFARDGMHVHAATAVAHMGAQGMLALLLDDDRYVSTDFTRGCFGRKMEIRRSRDGELYCAGDRFQVPVGVGARVSLNGDASRGGMRLHVTGGTLNLDFAAGGFRFDAPARLSNANDTRHRIDDYVALGIRDVYTSRSGRYMDFIADIRGRDGATGGGELGVALDLFDTHRS